MYILFLAVQFKMVLHTVFTARTNLNRLSSFRFTCFIQLSQSVRASCNVTTETRSPLSYTPMTCLIYHFLYQSFPVNNLFIAIAVPGLLEMACSVAGFMITHNPSAATLLIPICIYSQDHWSMQCLTYEHLGIQE